MTINAKLGDPSANSYVLATEAGNYITNKYNTTVWDNLSATQKEIALIQACKTIDRFNFIEEPYYDNQALHFPDSDHEIITGDVATPVTANSFTNTGFTSDTYGANKSNTDYWQYGSVHITAATPLYDIRMIASSNITTDVVKMTENFTSTPGVTTDFIAFGPLDKNIKHAQVEQALYIINNEGSDTLKTYAELGAKEVKIGDVQVKFIKGASMTKIPISSVSKKLISRYLRRNIRMGRA